MIAEMEIKRFMNRINPPIGTMLFLDPTDQGKTRVVEASAEVDWPEFRQLSEISTFFKVLVA
jgi:hypothetical protein